MLVSVFIHTEADRALAMAAQHTAPHRCLGVLLPYLSHRSSMVRAKAARGAGTCVERLGGKPGKVKNQEEMVRVLLKGLDDSNREVRGCSRDALAEVYGANPQEVLRLAERAQPEKGAKRLKEIVA